MTFAAVLLHIALTGSLGHAAGALPDWARPAPPDATVAELLHAEAPSETGNPPCVADTCQPRVAVPGIEPVFDLRGSNGFLLLAAERIQFGPLTTVARAVTAAGLRVQYLAPRTGLPGSPAAGRGAVTVGLRWRLGAWNDPPWAATLGAIPDDR